MDDQTNSLLRALLVTTARAAFPVTDVYKIVNPTGKGKRQVKAFNLADGTRTQSQIASQVRIESGNFSRMVRRWAAAGIIFRLGDGRDVKLLHVYPIPSRPPKE